MRYTQAVTDRNQPTNVTIKLEPKQMAELDRRCKALNLSKAAVVRELVEEFLKEKV